jgi:hypothetical protein
VVCGALADPSVQQVLAEHLAGGWTAVPVPAVRECPVASGDGPDPVASDPPATRVGGLPTRPEVVRGDPAALPRRRRSEPVSAFSFGSTSFDSTGTTAARPREQEPRPGGLTGREEDRIPRRRSLD